MPAITDLDWLDRLTEAERLRALAELVADPDVALEPIPGADLPADLVAAFAERARRLAARRAGKE